MRFAAPQMSNILISLSNIKFYYIYVLFFTLLFPYEGKCIVIWKQVKLATYAIEAVKFLKFATECKSILSLLNAEDVSTSKCKHLNKFLKKFILSKEIQRVLTFLNTYKESRVLTLVFVYLSILYAIDYIFLLFY